MDNPPVVDAPGQLDARYLAFLETITTLRPRLHRYCSRMTGSVLDGEDVVQDALFRAYRKLDTFDDSRPLGPWLFRIAHNRCIDFLRRRGVRQEAEAEAATTDSVPAIDPPGPALGRAVEHLVLRLPPKERACVLLKDVFDYSLEEIADLVGTTVGGVKAALNRGRSKLAALPERSTSKPAKSADAIRVLSLCVERFNRRDWDGRRPGGHLGSRHDQSADEGRIRSSSRRRQRRRLHGHAAGVGAWHPHMMVFAPYYENSMVGGNEFGSLLPR